MQFSTSSSTSSLLSPNTLISNFRTPPVAKLSWIHIRTPRRRGSKRLQRNRLCMASLTFHTDVYP